MRRPFKKFRRFVLIDSDEEKDLSQTEAINESGSDSNEQLIIDDTPSEDKQEITTFSQQ